MTLTDIARELNLEVICGENKLDVLVSGAHASDLLSDVMGRAQPGWIWITLQTHQNIVAVAALRELAAILVANNGMLDESTRETAVREGIVILRSKDTTFEVSGKLYGLMHGAAVV